MLSGSIKIWSELGEGSDFSVLSQLKFERTGNLFHSFDLCSWSDTRHRETDIDSWSDTFIEEFSFQEDLTISDWDDIGWNISGHITSLGFNNGESCQRSTSMFHVHLSCSFQKTWMQIEHITWIGFSTGRSSQKKRHLSVSDGLLWKIVIDDKSVLSVISEILSNSASWIRSQELKRSSIWSCGSNNDWISECILIF